MSEFYKGQKKNLRYKMCIKRFQILWWRWDKIQHKKAGKKHMNLAEIQNLNNPLLSFIRSFTDSVGVSKERYEAI